MKKIYTSFDEGTNNRTAVWSMCEAGVRAWAERCGAELINLPKPTKYQPQWVIFDAFKHSVDNNVDGAVWIDCDIFVRDHAPNIFDMDDKFFFCQPDPVNRIHPYMRKQFRRGRIPNPRPYLISAIVKWSPRHVLKMIQWFDAEIKAGHPRFVKREGDQELLTIAAYETETAVAYFPPDMHKMTRWIKPNTPFMHAAGGAKVSKVKKFMMVDEKHKKQP